MATQTQEAATHGETIVADMVERIVERFDPERVFLLSYRATGNGEWYHVDLLVVKSGEADVRDARDAMRRELDGMGLAKDVHVTTPEGFARLRETPGHAESIAARAGRVLYERA